MSTTSTAGAAIATSRLTKRYGSTEALVGVDLTVPHGVIFGYLGPNGAGKTTTIRLLVGLLRPTEGTASVLGMDAVSRRDDVQRQVGYLAGEFVAYPDLTSRQYLQFLANLRGGVDPGRIASLAERLDLDLDRPYGTLSHGNRQKLGLIQAFMHDPELLILDEPTTGLDPLIQREFLSMVREAKAAGRTVFLSSHILAEVEAVADMVGILRQGALVVVEEVDELKEKAIHRLEIRFADPPPVEDLRAIAGVRSASADDSIIHLVVEGSTEDVFRVAAAHGIEGVRSFETDLEEIFLSYYTEG